MNNFFLLGCILSGIGGSIIGLLNLRLKQRIFIMIGTILIQLGTASLVLSSFYNFIIKF